MPWRVRFVAFALAATGAALGMTEPADAQNKVRTETIRPPASSTPPATKPDAAQPKPSGHATPPGTLKAGDVPEIIKDLSRLPAPVASARERILAAARTGELRRLLAVMQTNETLPVFSFSEDKDPVAYWKANYPDSDGIEVLSILITVLESGFVHIDKGTPQEIYLWPYFARMPVNGLTPEQKVELFRIITGNDYKDMLDFGAYLFYRLGIGPDGTWHFFVSGD
jgi:hypothetical protein